MIAMIAAMSYDNHVIGKAGKLPWTLPNDLAYFKRITMGSTIVMGRKTYDSIGKPLPGRRNIVLTKDYSFNADVANDLYAMHNVKDILALAYKSPTPVFIIGGAELYEQFMPHADRLYITEVFGSIEGDTFFPKTDVTKWKTVSVERGYRHEKNLHAHNFLVLH